MAQKLKKFDEQPPEGYLINLIEPFRDDFIIHGAVLVRNGSFIEPDGSVNRFNDCREKLLGWVYTFEPRPLPFWGEYPKGKYYMSTDPATGVTLSGYMPSEDDLDDRSMDVYRQGPAYIVPSIPAYGNGIKLAKPCFNFPPEIRYKGPDGKCIGCNCELNNTTNDL